ncbi:MAG: cysteine desulfurase family protein [Bacteroidota bacterium]
MRIYLDNAATTPIDPEVFEAMLPYLKDHFGNPSSTHSFGRVTKSAIEKVRKDVASILKCTTSELIFTSGGTEADNMAIYSAIHDLGVTRLISSRLEHHAVSHTVEVLGNMNNVSVEWVNTDDCGQVDLQHLDQLLSTGEKTLVSLMHANNEIGTLLPLKQVAELCKRHGAYLHSDTVQTVGHYHIDLSDIPVDFITCAAHKFHGPKGVGFLFVRKGLPFKAFISGGAQERDKRGGTENVYAIVGLGKAIELAYRDLDQHTAHIKGIREYMREQLTAAIPGIAFNCDPNGLYTVLNVNFPDFPQADMLLFTLDIEGVACSGGSACSSGSNKGSHVLAELKKKNSGPNVRFSFSKNTTKEEIDVVLGKLKVIFERASVNQYS